MKISAWIARSAAIMIWTALLVGLMGLTGLDSAAAQGKAGQERNAPRHSDMFYLAPTGYITLDSKGQVTESNLTAASMLGVSWDLLLSSSLSSFVVSDSRETFNSHFRAAMRQICKQAAELRFMGQDGQEVLLQLESMCVFDKRGNPCGFRVVMYDLADWQRVAEADKAPMS